jgi:hypothetical protein
MIIFCFRKLVENNSEKEIKILLEEVCVINAAKSEDVRFGGHNLFYLIHSVLYVSSAEGVCSSVGL